jgi:hypothetical protein
MQVLQLGQALSAQGLSSALPPSAQRRGQNGAAEQQTHAFWGTQPVAQFGDDPSAWVSSSKTGVWVQQGHHWGITQQSALLPPNGMSACGTPSVSLCRGTAGGGWASGRAQDSRRRPPRTLQPAARVSSREGHLPTLVC